MSLLPWLHLFKTGKVNLILGSASKPRRAILEQLGVPFQVMVSDFPEDLEKSLFHGSALEYSLATAREKMKCLLNSPALEKVTVPTVVITCDTVVLRDMQHIIEKPEDDEHAFTMIKSLSGVEHSVVTGVVICFISPGNEQRDTEFKVHSKVKFTTLSDETIRAYVASKEPLNKAGGYGVQGLGALLVEDITGSYSNVVGLPLYEVASAIAELLRGKVTY